MKKLLFALMMMLALATLVACGGEQSPPDDAGAVDKNVIYSPDVTVTVVRGDDISASDAAVLVNAVSIATGKNARVVDSSSEPCDHEIVIGSTTRPVTAKALQYLSAELDPTARLGGYAFYSEGKSVAIVATEPELIPDAIAAFVAKYMTESSLSAETKIYEIVSLSMPVISDAEWAARFDAYNGLISDEAVAQLKRIYAMFDDGTVSWMANLWEPYNCVCGECTGELACYGGGFYYANSARDYVGFLPDVESTSQLLGLVKSTGLLSAYNNDYRKGLPEYMQEAIVKFVQSLQSSTDKYFYHPQWGTSINSSRRGRDLDSSLGLLRSFGAQPLYGSPLESAEAAASADNLTRPLGYSTVAAVSAVISANSLPDYLKSEAAFREWLEALDINGQNKSYSAGHTISSIRSQIKAAGLSDFCIEWLNSKQLDNGLWEEGEVNYYKTNGVLKISTMYESWSAPFPRAEQCINAFMTMLNSDLEVIQITDIYNIWVGMGILVPNVQSFGDKAVYDRVRAELLADATNVFTKTLEKLLVFLKDDGSFSYSPGSSASSSQGAPASLGFDEGDVNATALAHSTMAYMLKTMGLPRVQTFNNNHYEDFLYIIENLTSVEKQIPENSVVDFNDYAADELPSEVIMSSNVTNGATGVFAIKEHADKPGDMYLSLTSGAGCGDTISKKITNAGPTDCFVLDTDICFHGGGIQIFLGTSVMITANANGDKIVIGDLNARTGGNISNSITKVDKNKWINLRVEHYPAAARTKFFVDGSLVFESDNFMGKNNAGTTKPTTSFSGVELYVTISAVSGFSVDNLLVDRVAKEYIAPEGGENPTPGTPEPDTGSVTLPTGNTGGAYFAANGGFDYSGGSIKSSQVWISGSTVLDGNPKDNPDAYARVVKNGDNSVLEFAKLSDSVNERHIGWRSADTSGDVYVFETDFLYTGCTLDNSDPWPIRFALQNATSRETSPDRTVSLIFRIDTNTGNLVHTATRTVLTKGEWHNIAIRYTKSTGVYEFLLNGQVFYTGTATAGVDIRGTSAELRAYASDLTVYFDNTTSTTVK